MNKIIIEVNEIRPGGFSGQCYIEDLTPEQMTAIGLGHMIDSDEQLVLDVEGSYDVAAYETPDYLDLSLVDVSVGYKGKFIFIEDNNFNYDGVVDSIIDRNGSRIAEDIRDSYPEPLDY